ncbi:hypothetical protein AB0L85_17490 [Streptomyces sp. NPDC052051]|uniref:hypothetical protein n=1 Tax=Streptomyces sp. NPDC052051 TaxID=3154649 RepID=UPI003418B6B8
MTLSKLASVVGTVGLAVAVGFGAAAPTHLARPAHPSAAQRTLANGTGPAIHVP